MINFGVGLICTIIYSDMRKIFRTMLICAIAFALVSCQKDDSGEGGSETSVTTLEATISTNFADIFDFVFTLDGKVITMKKSVNGNTIVYSYSDNQLHANGKIECTVTVSSKADVSSLPEKCDFSSKSNYQTSKTTSDGYLTLYRSNSEISIGGLSYSKLVQDGKVSDKASFAAYIATKIAVPLNGTMKQKS